jgi:hemoglobin-like flavoprotein
MAASQLALIDHCLELIAERVEDITPRVYAHFFAHYPQADELFGGRTGDAAKNQMVMNIVMQLLELANDKVYHHNIERWIYDHISYGVSQEMFGAMFSALLQTLQEVMGADWTAPHAQAWQLQIGKIMAYVDRLYAQESLSR